jgi:TPR repeat protein
VIKHTLTALVFGVALLLTSGGSGYAQDFQKGVEAAEKGDFATALREWRPLAEQGDAVAQYNLGLMYKKGDGVPQDDKEAVRWCRKSAEQGNVNAQFALGAMYGLGEGVLQDNVYAHMWLNIAASNGNATAIKNRDIVAKRMTASDISEAQKLARECVRKKYKGC